MMETSSILIMVVVAWVYIFENSSKYTLKLGAVTVYKLYLNKVYYKNRIYASRSWELNYRISDGKRALNFSEFPPLV